MLKNVQFDCQSIHDKYFKSDKECLPYHSYFEEFPKNELTRVKHTKTVSSKQDNCSLVSLLITHGQFDFVDLLQIVIPKKDNEGLVLSDFKLFIQRVMVGVFKDSVQLDFYNALHHKQSEDSVHFVYPIDMLNYLPILNLINSNIELQFSVNRNVEQVPDIELLGHQYFLESHLNKEIATSYSEHRYIQNQFHTFMLKKGMNQIKLNLNHPVFLIYLYGIDKTKVANVSICQGEKVFISLDRGNPPLFDDANKIVIYFSQTFNFKNIYANEYVNFSKLDGMTMNIDSEEAGVINVCALNYGVSKFSKGIFGLTFYG